jgi:type I restriction enzyme, S subunit
VKEMVPVTIPPNFPSPPAGWRWTKLTDVARLESGHTPSRFRPDWWGGDVSWISLTEIRMFDGRWTEATQLRTNEAGIAHSAARILPKGTVCFSRTASVGFVTIMAAPMATSQDFANWVCGEELDPEFLMYALIGSRMHLRDLASGATHKTIYMPTLEAFHVCIPDILTQRRISSRLKSQFSLEEVVRVGAQAQMDELTCFGNAVIRESCHHPDATKVKLGDVLEEVARGIGKDWSRYPVLGATRDGLAPAKEPVGKAPDRYKLVSPGTVFYNPMRIMIGSIAMVDDGDATGITSPDYVVLKGREGRVHSRWFYYWLRSPYGKRCIESLARGAVRERMLFNRLADGEISLPPYSEQQAASAALAPIREIRAACALRLREIALLPTRMLRLAFENS